MALSAFVMKTSRMLFEQSDYLQGTHMLTNN